MVEVFKTNVEEDSQAEALIALLIQQLPDCEINFDLDDCDKILRIAGDYVKITHIERILNQEGFKCKCLQ